MTRIVRDALVALPLVLLAGAQGVVAQASLVSVSSSGAASNGDSFLPSMTPDGRYIAFETLATNLVVPDAGNFRDIVLKDLQTGAVERISVNSAEGQGNSHSFDPWISADGRYVVFSSWATNLVASDLNGLEDVFLRDRVAGTTVRVSVTNTGLEASGASLDPRITPDGRYVVFQSAGDLVPPWHPGTYNIYVRDMVAGTITLETPDADLQSGWADNYAPVLTPDARYVVFAGGSDEMVPGDTNFAVDIYVRDRLLDTFERVSLDALGMEHPGGNSDPAISNDGRFVAFVSEAFLDPDDNNTDRDIYVRDRLLQTTHLLTPFAKGGIFDSPASLEPAISADGRWVVFQSDSFTLVPNDVNSFRDIFVHDMLHDVLQKVTYGFAGDLTNEISSWPVVSPDAHRIAFGSKANNLVPGDGNAKQDIFVLQLGPWQNIGSALAGSGGLPGLAGHGTLESGSLCDLTLGSAKPSALSLLFASLGSTPVPFKGGVLVAFPFIAQVVLVTDGAGGLFLPFAWPAGVPSGTHLDFQFAVQDGSAVAGVALSNALDALTP